MVAVYARAHREKGKLVGTGTSQNGVGKYDLHHFEPL